MAGRALTLLRVGSFWSRTLPLVPLTAVVEAATARVAPRLMAGKASLLQRNIERVVRSGGALPGEAGSGEAGSGELDAAAAMRRGFASYGRYWVEFFRLPHLTDRQIDRGFSFVGYDKIEEVRAAGYGPILVLPHLGGWEWAAAWLGRIAKVEVTAVVERLEPEEVYSWFARLRQAIGVEVVPLGPGAMTDLQAAVRRGSVICLLADRDIGNTGVEVDFFGETTTLPAGPAMLSRRTGSPVMPVAVFFRGRQRICIVGDAIWPEEWNDPSVPGRERTARVTQLLATRLEALISQAPEQWHLLEANWPSDRSTG
ncbi:MAG: phosphatidylinositol mannoside acyltransferase [Actinomycetota bacterium]